MDSIINKVKLPDSSTVYGITDVRIGTSAVSSPTHLLGYNSSNADAIGSVAITSISSTDTKNTAGATDTSAKLFLIGATTQGTNPQTYSQDTAYVDTDGCLYSGGNKVITDISGKADTTSPAFTGVPTAPTADAGTNTTQIATTAFVKAAVDASFQANDAMLFKGTISSDSDLPATHYQGWTYKVATAGNYAGVSCEVGDMIICITDGTSANNNHWTVVLTNLDGVVTGPSSSVANRVATFDGTTGKIIKDSGYTIATSVPSNAVFTDHEYTAGTGLSLTSGAFALATVTGLTEGSYGPSADVTGSNNTTMNVPYITVDSYGRVTSISNKTFTAQDSNTKNYAKIYAGSSTGASNNSGVSNPYIKVGDGTSTSNAGTVRKTVRLVGAGSTTIATTDTSGTITITSPTMWTGTLAQYDAITTKDTNTFYFITES